jgi:hypothetical protein
MVLTTAGLVTGTGTGDLSVAHARHKSLLDIETLIHED